MSQEVTKIRVALEEAISAAMPVASDRLRAALTGVLDELAAIDKNNALFTASPNLDLCYGLDVPHARGLHPDQCQGCTTTGSKEPPA